MSSAVRLAVACLLAASTLHAQTPYSGHGAGSIPPEVVKKYAPPPLDPEVAGRIQAMIDVRSPGLGLVSPDGKRLFFGWNIAGAPAVWRLDGPRAFPVQMTGGEDRTSVAGITPDGRRLVLSRDRGGQEDPGLYLQSVEGGALRVVQHVPTVQTLPAFTSGAAVTSGDSRWVYFVANDLKPGSYAVYRYDVAAGEKELLLSQDGIWRIADYREEPSDTRLLLRKATGALSSEYHEWDITGRTLKPLLGQGEATEYTAAWAADPTELLVLTNKLGDFRRLYRCRADRGLTAVTPEMKMDVSDFTIDPARRHVYYTVNDGGYTRLRVLDARTLAPVPFPEFKDADHVYTGAPSRDGRYVTLGVETSRAPRANYVYDWETKSLTQWVLPSAPEVDLAEFAVARLESYPARDGTKVPAFVRYPAPCAPEAPPGGDPCPVVVDFHGGPEGQAQPGFNPYAQLFVDAGFVFVEPNVRGSDGYGKAWLEADNGPRRLEVITDIDVTYLDRVKAPLLLIQGVDDPRVPAGEAVQIQERLAARGVSSSLTLVEGEGHGAARRAGRVLMTGHTLRFLEEHLLGGKPAGGN